MATSAGLTQSTQKSLLLDLKTEGGLEAVVLGHKLEKICNSNTAIYGLPNSKLRVQVQNKVDYLRKNPKSYINLQKQLLGTAIDELPDPVFVSPLKNSKADLSSPTDLSLKFDKLAIGHMSSLNPYGQVKHDETHVVATDAMWKNRGLLIWKTPAVTVGLKPTWSTAVYSLVAESVDPRFFTIDNFEPYKMTQVGNQELVYEYPCAGYDTLFGEQAEVEEGSPNVQEELEDEEGKELETMSDKGRVLSRNPQEQKEYLGHYNALTTTADGEEPDYSTYRAKLLLKFPDNLNYKLLAPSNSAGEISYRYVLAGDSPFSMAVKWRIAVDDREKKIVKKNKKNKNKAKEKFERFAKSFGTMFDEDKDEGL